MTQTDSKKMSFNKILSRLKIMSSEYNITPITDEIRMYLIDNVSCNKEAIMIIQYYKCVLTKKL